jgi:hypothetical protein
MIESSLTFEGLALNDTTTPTNCYLITKIDDSFSTDLAAEPKIELPGVEAQPIKIKQRSIVFTGIAHAPSRGSLNAKREELRRVFNPYLLEQQYSASGSFRPLTYNLETTASTSARQVNVKPYQLPSLSEARNEGFNFGFKVYLLAEDPREYAQTASSGTTGTYTNAGNFPTWPTFDIVLPSGTTSASVGISGSSAMTITGLASGGTTAWIDMEKRAITTGAASGNAYGSKTTGSAFFSLPSGNTSITGSLGTITGSWRSAWL